MSEARESLYRDSLRVLADIAEAGPFVAHEAWCCFHFLTDGDAGNDLWGDEAQAPAAARPLFEALPFPVTVDYIGGSVGIEAWERAVPDEGWIKDRLPRMWDIAEAAGVRFVGWTFEPQEPRIFQATP